MILLSKLSMKRIQVLWNPSSQAVVVACGLADSDGRTGKGGDALAQIAARAGAVAVGEVFGCVGEGVVDRAKGDITELAVGGDSDSILHATDNDRVEIERRACMAPGRCQRLKWTDSPAGCRIVARWKHALPFGTIRDSICCGPLRIFRIKSAICACAGK